MLALKRSVDCEARCFSGLKPTGVSSFFRRAFSHKKGAANSLYSGSDSEKGVFMPDPVYVSRVRIERRLGPMRLAYLPVEPDPVWFGVHGAVAEHYRVKVDMLEPHATTLDYIVAATGG